MARFYLSFFFDLSAIFPFSSILPLARLAALFTAGMLNDDHVQGDYIYQLQHPSCHNFFRPHSPPSECPLEFCRILFKLPPAVQDLNATWALVLSLGVDCSPEEPFLLCIDCTPSALFPPELSKKLWYTSIHLRATRGHLSRCAGLLHFFSLRLVTKGPTLSGDLGFLFRQL